MPDNKAECQQWVAWIKKTAPDDPLSFAIAGSKAEVLVTMARNKKPEILKKLIRDDVDARIKTDKKFKDDRTFWNWGDLYEERGALTLRFSKEVKTGVAKAIRRFFRKSGVPLKFDLTLLGPDGAPAEQLGMNDSDDDAPSPPNPQGLGLGSVGETLRQTVGEDKKAQEEARKAYELARKPIDAVIAKGKVPVAWSPADYNEITRLGAEAAEQARVGTVSAYQAAQALVAEAEEIRARAVAEVGRRVELAKETAALSKRVEALTDANAARALAKDLAEVNAGLRNDPDFDYVKAEFERVQADVIDAEKAQAEGREARPQSEKDDERRREDAMALAKIRMEIMRSFEPHVAEAAKEMRRLIATMLETMGIVDLKPEHFNFMLDQVFNAKTAFFRDLNAAADRSELERVASEGQDRLDQAVAIAARALDNDDQLKTFAKLARKAAKAAQDRPAFTQARAELAALEEALRDAGLDDYAGKLVGAVEKTESDANKSQDYAAGTEELKRFTQTARDMLQKHNEKLRQKREAVAEKIAQFERDVSTAKGSNLERALKFLKRDTTNDASFTAIKGEIDKSKKLLAEAANEDAIDAVLVLLETVESALDDLGRDDGLAATVNGLNTEISKLLGDPAFKKHAETLAELRKTYAEAQEAVDPLHLKGAVKSLTALRDEVTTARDAAKRKNDFRKAAVTRHKTLTKNLTKLSEAIKKAARTANNQDLTNGYVGPMTDDLAAIKIALNDPELDDLALGQQMDEIEGRIALLSQKAQKGGQNLIDALADDVTAAKKKKQDEADAKLQKAEDKKKINALYKELKPKLKEAEKKVKAVKGDLGEVSELKKSVALAYKNRNENGAGAITVFTRTLNRAIELIEFPGGPASKALADLPKAPQSWRGAVAQCERAAETLMDKVRAAAASTMLDATIEGMERDLLRALAAFDPHVFDGDVALLCDLDQDKERRGKAKEAILRQTRSYQRLLMSDPLLLHAAANPFGVPQLLTPMYKALGDLELNASRARI